MINRILSLCISVVALSSLSANGDTEVLGKSPMCEASAALLLPCGDGDCLVVGDNEVRDTLYQFPIENNDLKAQEPVDIFLGDEIEISDIEALVNLGSDRVLVLGSHSRNKKCDPKKKRRRFLVAERIDGGFKVDGETVQSKKIKCDRVLGSAADDSKILKAVCESIDEAEKQANAIFEALGIAGKAATEEACGKAAPFNIEGAVAIPASNGPELWVGLRGPLVEMSETGAERRFAVLLRMKGQAKLSFNAAALVALGGLGIRELTVAGGWVWGIAGPPEDSSATFKMWRFPIRSLRANAKIEVEWITELPTSSEGLALSGSTAYVVIDGDQGSASCDKPARYQVVRVPNY